MQGEFSEFYRYRLGDYRLFYTIDEEETVVIIADLRSRQTSYRAFVTAREAMRRSRPP